MSDDMKTIFGAPSLGLRGMRVDRWGDGDYVFTIVDEGGTEEIDALLSGKDAVAMARSIQASTTGRRAAYERVLTDLETLLREGVASVEESRAARVVADMLRRSIETGIAED